MAEEHQGEEFERIPIGEYVFLPMDRVVFGPGSVARLDEEVERIGAKRIMVVTTKSLVDTDVLQKVTGLIEGRIAGIFSGVQQHVPGQTVLEAVREAERLRADMLISVGGGSVIDTTKAATLALARDKGSFLPHIALPTTLSAAEFSTTFGITDEKTRTKSRGSSPWITPRVVILDVDLTARTPNWLWLGSGIRALDHAVETVYAPDHQPATDATALEAIRLLFHHLPASVGDGDTRAARQQCQIAAWLSFFGVANVTLGLSHALGREIGPRYNVPHGFTSAVLLPKVMAYLLPSTLGRQALIARAAGAANPQTSEAEAALQAPPAVTTLISQLGLPQRLRDLHVPESDLDDLAAGRPDVAHILREAW